MQLYATCEQPGWGRALIRQKPTHGRDSAFRCVRVVRFRSGSPVKRSEGPCEGLSWRGWGFILFWFFGALNACSVVCYIVLFCNHTGLWVNSLHYGMIEA